MPQTTSGSILPFDARPGLGAAQSLTNPSVFADFDGEQAQADPATNPIASAPPKVSTLWYLFAIVLLMVLLKFAIEHEKSGVEVSYVGIGFYNWVATGLMVLTFLILWKTIFNKYHVPGLTDLSNIA